MLCVDENWLLQLCPCVSVTVDRRYHLLGNYGSAATRRLYLILFVHAQLYYSDLIQQCPQYPILLALLSLFIYTTPPVLPPLPLFPLSLSPDSHPSRTCSTIDIKSDLLWSNRIVSDPRKCCQTNPPSSHYPHPSSPFPVSSACPHSISALTCP